MDYTTMDRGQVVNWRHVGKLGYFVNGSTVLHPTRRLKNQKHDQGMSSDYVLI